MIMRTHKPWSPSLKMCSCLGRLLQPQPHQSESWALPRVQKNVKNQASQSWVKLILSINIKHFQWNSPLCGGFVSTFPTARPPTTEQITPHTFTSRVCKRHGMLAALCQASGTVPVDLPGTPTMETCLYCTYFCTLSRTTLGILTPFR